MPGKKNSTPPKPGDTSPIATRARSARKKDDKSSKEGEHTPRPEAHEDDHQPSTPKEIYGRLGAE